MKKKKKSKGRRLYDEQIASNNLKDYIDEVD